jgi:putative oxidoreductase
VLGGVSVLLGIWADLGSLLLALFLIPTAILMHGFWKETDPQAKMTEMNQFSKDLALGGAALMLLGLFSIAGDKLGLTITGPLF